VEKGVPLPLLKYHPGSYKNPKISAWAGFLEKLTPGDSFVVYKNQTQSLMIQARRLGVILTWRAESANKVRVWVVPEDKLPKAPKRKWDSTVKKQVNWEPGERESKYGVSAITGKPRRKPGPKPKGERVEKPVQPARPVKPREDDSSSAADSLL
jgi:hypothetical protein